MGLQTLTCIVPVLMAVVLLPSTSCYNYFTSTDAMEDLYDLELFLVRYLENYIKEEQNILSLLSGRYEQAARSLSNIVNREHYVANPINSFSLLRRLTQDWPKTLSLLSHNKLKDLTLPTEEDMAGAVRALTRLQDVYSLSATSLASGHLPGTHKTAVLCAADCVAVAQLYYNRHDFQLATDWLLEALGKVHHDRTCPPGLILENLFITTCFEGDQDLSTYYLQELLEKYPLYIPPDHLVKDYNLALTGKCKEISDWKKLDKIKSVPELEQVEIDEYHRMCRGPLPALRELQCHLVHYNHSYLRLQPFKLEELYLEPPVVMFHDVVSDDEIAHFRKTAFSSMKRAKIVLPNGTVSAALYRTSHIAWLEDSDPVSLAVNRRIAAMTDLDVSRAETNQINLTHGDLDGNRLATFMIYMSDVGWGGHTVFPDLQISVRPKKGAALFWYNLHHDGTIDYRMRHAACPVIVGTKWVLNKWLHEAGQELRYRPHPVFVT
ncbi:prolyl 4-hydroxylase subunit alpha-1-like isoform X2 [Homalodisca vitripennis]|uniref:prolyl 4-hydroxylase subunit alpha-1-like isoform X2 n=1 Tax=Homalodisca vitripennis TaxID=197043 RepID=UPI001EEA0C68|nr:prolyl 4-hydroxylase subunit alpha-1-like isoform X2 [Homalodisca vitripennis]